MGDRALVQMYDSKEDDHSPVLYLHWTGDRVPDLLKEWHTQMLRRGADLQYGFARLVGRACNMNGGDKEALSVGVWNAKERLKENDSHGDAGVFLVDVRTLTVTWGGGYRPTIHPRSPFAWETFDGGKVTCDRYEQGSKDYIPPPAAPVAEEADEPIVTYDRALNDDERALLAELATTGGVTPAPIGKLPSGKWRWQYRSLHGPVLYHTKRAAQAAFNTYLDVLGECQRAEAKRRGVA